MKLAHQQLDSHLSKTLAPIYVVSGDEILLVQETLDRIRTTARAAGYTERVTLTIDPGADWGKLLYAESHSLSLFATKRIVELQLAGAKPNAASSKILQDIANNPLADTLLLISMNKLDSKAEQTAWYKALDKKGITVPVWPIALEQLPTWIMQRAKKSGLNITADAAKLLAEQMEGNLLAAAQEIDKLCLLQTSGSIDINTIEKAVTDNSRYDIFGLVECALSGNNKRSLHILENLHAEDVEPVLVLWALTREIRTLADIAKQMKQGAQLGSLFSKFRIWEKRQASVRRFLQQHNQQSCWSLLCFSAKIDRIIKGAATGDVWLSLQQLVLRISGSVILNA